LTHIVPDAGAGRVDALVPLPTKVHELALGTVLVHRARAGGSCCKLLRCGCRRGCGGDRGEEGGDSKEDGEMHVDVGLEDVWVENEEMREHGGEGRVDVAEE
jgi:hypothetical protein